ncbi:MAG: CinA family protein [Mariprofundus sp.]
MKRARWIISERGLQSLAGAGMSTGWLRAWLYSAGADVVHMSMLASNEWQGANDQWRLFFATEAELERVSEELADHFEHSVVALINPDRQLRCYRQGRVTTLLLPLGDIAFQRHQFLNLLNDNSLLKPVYVYADEQHELPLEAGLSASMTTTGSSNLLNRSGQLIEEQVIAVLRDHSLLLRTVESCTAGMIIARLCRVPGASDVVDRGWVTYCNTAKCEQVGVPQALIDQYGAVSKAVVTAMAAGGAVPGSVAVAVSGIAGPGGGSAEKPVGTVWIALSMAGETTAQCLHLSGSRPDIQAQTVVAILQLLLTKLSAIRQ